MITIFQFQNSDDEEDEKMHAQFDFREALLQGVMDGKVSTRWLRFLLRTPETSISLEDLCQMRRAAPVYQHKKLSLLMACIVFCRANSFHRLFPILYKSERANHDPRIWNLILRNKELVKAFHKTMDWRRRISTVCALTYILGAKTVQRCEELCKGLITRDLNAQDIINAMLLWVDPDGSHLRVIPISFDLLNSVQEPSMLPKRILPRLIEMTLKHGSSEAMHRWVNFCSFRVLSRMEHVIIPWMRMKFVRRARKRKTVQADADALTVAKRVYVYEKKVVAELGNGRLETVVPDPMFDLTQEFVFVKAAHGICHETFRAHLDKYGGFVQRLNFGRQRVNGMVFPKSMFEEAFPMCSVGSDGYTVTGVDVVKTVRGGVKKRRSTAVPFESNAFLNKDEMERLRPLFNQFNDEERFAFYLVFWKFPGCDETSSHFGSVVGKVMDALVNLESKEGITRCIERAEVWRRVHRILKKIDHPLQVVSEFVTSQNVLDVLLRLIDRPHLLNMIIKLLVVGEITVTATRTKMIDSLRFLLFARDTPPVIRRLAYQSAMLSSVDWHAASPSKNAIGFEADLVMPMVSSVLSLGIFDSILMKYDRLTNKVNLATEFRSFIGRNLNERLFDLSFENEDGRGRAVFEEVLDLVWRDAIETGLFEMYDDVGYAVAVDGDRQKDDKVFILGFITGLCIARGLYLPIRIAEDMWSFLFLDLSFGVIPYRVIFSRFSKYFDETKELSNEDFATLFDQPVSNDADRFGIIERASIPDTSFCSHFRAGFDIFMARINMAHVPNAVITEMFCSTKAIRVTMQSFLKVIDLFADARNEKLLQVLADWSDDQLTQFVQFITGKPRLPNFDIGEDRIRIMWSGRQEHKLPVAQNCSSTLFMPATISVDEVKQGLETVIAYDSVFGLL